MNTNKSIMILGWLLVAGLNPLYSHSLQAPVLPGNPPVWTVDPSAFSFDGEISAQVIIDGLPVTGGNGILGAFVKEECRGVKTGGITGPSGKYVFILRCYSDAASGETMTFKYYDPLRDTVYSIVEPASFEADMTLGDARNPTILHVNAYTRVIRKLSAGWTWFSLNVEQSDMSIRSVLGSVKATEGDYIKNQTLSARYYRETGWLGELARIDPKEMYKIRLAQPDTLIFAGYPVDSTAPISIKKGWNWIGYLPQKSKAVTDALSSIVPIDHDYIKSQIKSSTFYNGSGWFGELKALDPLDGYMLKSSHTGTLIYTSDKGNTFTDIRDGKVYKWVRIGTQVWMAENLAILPAVSPSNDGSLTLPYYYVQGYEGVSVFDAKQSDNYQTYGVLYNWPAAMLGAAGSNLNPSGVQGICPEGWHLPSNAEVDVLLNYLVSEPGKKMKTTSGWNFGGNGTNSTGFNGMPGGYRDYRGFFWDIGNYGSFWTSVAQERFTSYRYRLNYLNDAVWRDAWMVSGGYAIRCIRN